MLYEFDATVHAGVRFWFLSLEGLFTVDILRENSSGDCDPHSTGKLAEPTLSQDGALRRVRVWYNDVGGDDATKTVRPQLVFETIAKFNERRYAWCGWKVGSVA